MGEGRRTDSLLFWRLVFLLPSLGEACLNLVSQALPSAASAVMLGTTSSSDPPGRGHSWMGFPEEDSVMWTIYCENQTPKFLNTKLKGAFSARSGRKASNLSVACFCSALCEWSSHLVLLQGSKERPKLSYNRFLHFRKDMWSVKEKNKQCCCSHLELSLEQHGNVFS